MLHGVTVAPPGDWARRPRGRWRRRRRGDEPRREEGVEGPPGPRAAPPAPVDDVDWQALEKQPARSHGCDRGSAAPV